MRLDAWVLENRHLLTPALFERWEAMQARHVPGREGQLNLIVRIVGEAMARRGSSGPFSVFDLGCGPAGLLVRILRESPEVKGGGIDADPFLIELGRAAHPEILGERAQILVGDLRTLFDGAAMKFDAVVSSLALHWLSREAIRKLYRGVARALTAGGLLVIQDPLAGETAWRQKVIWAIDAELKAAMRSNAETWSEFWENLYSGLPGLREAHEEFKALSDTWEGTDDGYPWSFHAHALADAGFASAEIFHRHGRNAVFGASRA